METTDTMWKRAIAGARIGLLRSHPAKLLLFGYVSYILLGWALLALPPMQAQAVSALDALFIATSAVSTTGLVTVDPGTSFTLAGEIVILLLIQLGGLGYMTIGSFAVLAVQNRLSGVREKTARAAFNLPEDISARLFLRSVILFTLVVEVIGAAVLFPMFAAQGVEDPLWAAIFHAVSAFCTAGFSLFATSLEAFRDHAGISLVISALSLLGAMGFLIVVDGWRMLIGRANHLGFYSKVILRVTFWFLVAGTAFIFVAEPTLRDLPQTERLLAAFFQTMTATTTVGFNTHPIGPLSLGVILIIIFLMVFGASPAGTGGGLKSTCFAALVGLVKSTLKGRDCVRFAKRRVPNDKLQTATASFAFYFGMLTVALVALSLTEVGQPLELLLFEAASAMGTVGLSMGLTGELSDLGKLIIIVLMTAGRIGILSFGIALATHDESREEEDDNNLVL
ncbi:MAG: potassium transporter TrkG [Pseudomonadota bacterium]